jgi:hypothetical protein
MSLSIIHYRQNPTLNSELLYPSLFENVTERQTWVENGMYRVIEKDGRDLKPL